MAQLIQFKRRAAIGIPDILLAGEPLYNMAENAFYIGTGSAVVRFDAGAFNGDCSTAAATAAKVVACPGIVLLKGVEVTIKFTVTNTVAPASLTLNVGGTGPKAIKYRGANLPSADVLSANRTYKFRYNGTEWELIGDLDTDTTVGAALSSHTGNSTIHITSTERTNWNAVVTDFGNLEIGGRNLIIKSATTTGWYNGLGVFIDTPEAWISDFIEVSEGKEYTAKSFNSANNVGGRLIYFDADKTYVTRGERRLEETFVIPTGVGYIRYQSDKVGGEYVDDAIIVKGNKAPTDWTPAPEDQVSDWSTTDVNSFSFIKNKPTLLSQFTDNIGVATHIANTSNPHSVTKAQVGLGNVENTALTTWAGSTAITTLGTIATGTWNATTIAVGKGGTGKTSIASGKMLYASAANTYSELTTSSFGRGLLNAASGTMVTGLNADQIDGYHAAGLWRTDNAGSSLYDWSAKNLNVAGYLQIGSARLVYVPADAGTGTQGYIKLQHSDGTTAMHLVTTGGQTMYSEGVPAGSGSGGATVILNGVTTENAVFWAPTTAGTQGQYLIFNNGLPTWTNFPTTWAWGSLTGIPSTFTPSAHTHDDRYYTETEINTLLANKSNWDTAYGWGNHASAGYAAASALSSHTGNTSNPHSVTKSQVGLGNVLNVASYSKTESDTNLTSAISAIEIGGRNLIANTSSEEIVLGGFPDSGYSEGIRGYTINPATKDYYVLSFDAKSTVTGDEIQCHFFQPDTTTNTLTSTGYSSTSVYGTARIIITDNWQRYWIKYTQDGAATTTIKCWIVGRRVSGGGTGIISVRSIKLEKGNKATDWTPAPEDQVSDWSTTDVTSFSFIKNKPTQLSQFTDNIGVALHIANTSNPHSVTKEQVGLGSVENTALSTYAGSTAQDWSAKSLTLAGAITGATTGSFSSTISANRIVVTSTSNEKHLEFSRSDYNYIASKGHIGFITGGTGTGSANQQVWIHSNGNTKIGAGSSSVPAYTLDVNGTGRYTSNLSVGGTIQATTAKLTNLSDGYLPYHVSDASGLANSPIYTDGANVGIGTTAPEVIFQIGEIHQYGEERVLIAQPNNPINERGILNIVSSDAPGIDVGGSLSFGGSYANNFETAWASIAGRKENDNSVNYAGYLQFGTRVHGSPIQEQMRITSTGNVGIGYTDPGTYKLKVNGTGYFNSNLSVGGTLGVTGNTTLSGTLGVTGATTLATATVTNQLNFGSDGKWINLNGSANLYDVTAFNLLIKHPTPFIDFYFGEGSTVTSRIIELAAGVLDVIGSVKIPDSKYLQIGSARLTYETVSGVGFLKLAHSNGTTPMHLVTTGGQTMYSTGVPATGGGGGAIIQLNGATLGEGETAIIYSPTSIGYPGYILKAANPSGLPVWDSITNLLPDASTSVKGVAMLAGSGSATTVAKSDHNHSGVYAASAHNHYSIGDADNALLLTGRTVTIHTDLSPSAGFWKSDNSGKLSVDTNTYALSSHNHTGVYAPLSHSHDYLNSTSANMTDVRIGNTNGLGIRFWDQDEYKIFMSQATDVSYGGRILGETTSDYNMYFRFGTYGVNRGFVFESSYGVKLASINPDGFRTTLPFIIRSTNTSYDDSQLLLGGATFNYDAASALVELNKGIKFSAGVIEGAVLSNYGVCSTAASTGAKTVTISGFRLATGVQINVKFSNNNYAYPMTLNVSNTGAKTVKAYGDNDEQSFLEQIQAGAIVPFVYDGTYWVIPTTPSMY